MIQMMSCVEITLSCLLLFQITRGEMTGKHNFSLHTRHGWKWTVPPLIGLIGEWEGASYWRVSGLGYFLAHNEPFIENRHHCCGEEKNLSWVKKKGLIEWRMWTGYRYLCQHLFKKLAKCFLQFAVSCGGEHKINHKPRWLPRGWLQHVLSCRSKITAIRDICGWWQMCLALFLWILILCYCSPCLLPSSIIPSIRSPSVH